jgi:hypothetical protein
VKTKLQRDKDDLGRTRKAQIEQIHRLNEAHKVSKEGWLLSEEETRKALA